MKNKRFYILFICSFLVPAIAFTGFFLFAAGRYKTALNVNTARLIGSVKEKYPNVSDEEILSLLEEENEGQGREFLEKYGRFGDEFFMDTARDFTLKCLVLGVSAALFVFLFSLAAVLYREKKQKEAMIELISYLREIENGVYTLKISENTEDELSKLSNEIYKITVLLRETALESEKHTKALSVYLTDISHQIKTPLTSISIMLDNVLETPGMDEETKRDFLNEIRRQISHISSLVITLLKLSRLDSGTVEFSRSPVTAGELIEASLKNVAVLLDVKNIEASVSGDTGASVTVDKKWQTEALTNIIKNAAEHSGENSRIDINAENSGLFVSIRVRDHGEGVDESDLKHIFERFYKAKNSASDLFGVGLSLAKTVVEKDNGTVRVSSKKGEGATFTVAYRRV
ncbi:MAG: HAMP domain-containing histidine kinase [Clostridia bacterium]|nr:HAMP domain-containing histidine kinase [Clostridia bacterium]